MVGIVRMEVEGPLILCINGGMAGNMGDGVGPSIVGNVPTIVCAMENIPLEPGPIGLVEGIPIMIGRMDVSPLLTIPI